MSIKSLAVINGTIWLIAGINVVRLGVISWERVGETSAWMIAGCILTFIPFGWMFMKMVFKNLRRISLIPKEKRHLWHCMPLKSFLIMVFMIALGITLRSIPAIPQSFIAFFYVGLGTALALAGVVYFASPLAPLQKAREVNTLAEEED